MIVVLGSNDDTEVDQGLFLWAQAGDKRLPKAASRSAWESGQGWQFSTPQTA